MRKREFSEDFHIFRTPRGIILTRPEKEHLKKMVMYDDTHHTVKTILQLSCNVYFSNIEHRYQLVNDWCAATCGFDSATAAQHKIIYDTSDNDSAEIILANNNEVMNKHTMKIIEEELILKNHAVEQGLSIKLPCYDMNNKVCGIFGLTILIGKQKLAPVLSQISEIGLLNQDKYLQAFDSSNMYFTKREKEIIYMIKQNKTSKEMSTQLFISSRTVEKHIENIKFKLNVKSKYDIIEKAKNQHNL